MRVPTRRLLPRILGTSTATTRASPPTAVSSVPGGPIVATRLQHSVSVRRFSPRHCPCRNAWEPEERRRRRSSDTTTLRGSARRRPQLAARRKIGEKRDGQRRACEQEDL